MKIKALIIFFLFSIFAVNAQNEDWKQKIKSLKIAYITEHLDLTPKEAEKFWPIYNKHDDKINELRHVEMRRIKHQLKEDDIANISEADAKKLLNEYIQLEEDLINEHKQMNIDLMKVLSAKKIILLKKIEDDFGRQLLQKLRDKKGH
ncbi:hypothetical protein SAMN05216480_10771 [Pustulibacterium marinum]|uniref:Sensor of ECF-type sigma factor n=1 Tax=Pustulibacterium marinum TaxID=1224947 RepID=A0A1I7H553_9FLAO|nr:hypothetical protein [Pustulibacterium marinum]SFU55814.1 hypothetical protein SAMN05216480_10771 [Pustulibacterium marinum]